MTPTPRPIAIIGPTGTGKSQLALAVACAGQDRPLPSSLSVDAPASALRFPAGALGPALPAGDTAVVMARPALQFGAVVADGTGPLGPGRSGLRAKRRPKRRHGVAVTPAMTAVGASGIDV